MTKSRLAAWAGLLLIVGAAVAWLSSKKPEPLVTGGEPSTAPGLSHPDGGGAPRTPLRPEFHADGNEKALADLNVELKKAADEGRLSVDEIFKILDELRQAGAPREEIEDFITFVTSIQKFDTDGYLRLITYVTAGEVKDGLEGSMASLAKMEDLPKVASYLAKMQNDRFRYRLVEDLIVKHFTGKTADAEISSALALIDQTTPQGPDREGMLRNYISWLAGDVLRSDTLWKERRLEEYSKWFTPRESSEIANVYAIKMAETGDFDGLDKMIEADQEDTSAVLSGIIFKSDGLDSGLATQLLARVPEDSFRPEMLLRIARGVGVREGEAGSERFMREHYTPAEITAIQNIK